MKGVVVALFVGVSRIALVLRSLQIASELRSWALRDDVDRATPAGDFTFKVVELCVRILLNVSSMNKKEDEIGRFAPIGLLLDSIYFPTSGRQSSSF
jgi:hypothetical protein